MASVPGIPKLVQTEETSFRSPGSESMIQKVAGSLNWLENAAQKGPIGEIRQAMLTEAQFQTLNGTGWVLADGRSVTGTLYETLTGFSTIPDLRGMFLRNQQGTRAVGGNPDGNLPLGTYTVDDVASHTHDAVETLVTTTGSNLAQFTAGQIVKSGTNRAYTRAVFANIVVTINPTGGLEAAPYYGVVNYFVRIDKV